MNVSARYGAILARLGAVQGPRLGVPVPEPSAAVFRQIGPLWGLLGLPSASTGPAIMQDCLGWTPSGVGEFLPW